MGCLQFFPMTGRGFYGTPELLAFVGGAFFQKGGNIRREGGSLQH